MPGVDTITSVLFLPLLPWIFSGLHFPHALTIIFYKAEKRLVPHGIAREDQMEG